MNVLTRLYFLVSADNESQGLFNTQCVESILNKIAKTLEKTYAGLKSMLHGFRICFFEKFYMQGCGKFDSC